MKSLLFLSFLLVFTTSASCSNPSNLSSTSEKDGIEWISFDELQKKMETEPRKVIIDVYTNWCGPCKRMEIMTFQNAVISNYVNKKYYAIKFNAEDKKTINFRGGTFKHVAGGRNGINELTQLLIHNNAFPTIVFMNENLDVIQKFNYLVPQDMEMIMKFIGEEEFKKQPWEDYTKSFKSEL